MDGPRIHVLPDFLVDQIAAGEVVENPASVVKELVENALDAGARRVVVEVEGGGLALVRVTDDGCGMTPDEAALAMRRHATSKIANAGDLEAIRTLGFRGEALPSIASVSRFVLRTRTRDADAGVEVEAERAGVTSRPVATPVGTAVTVRDLFFNVPARLKFQKGERSRVGAVQDVVQRAALAHPGVHFTLLANGRRSADLPPCTRLADRAAMVFGREAAGRLWGFAEERDGMRVSGVAGEPALARPDPGRIALLVNGRPVQDMAIRRAVVQAYSVLVPAGSYPVAVVAIEIDPADVDVNVHPRKVEVRFRRHREVAALVFGALQAAVAATPWVDKPSVGGTPAEAGGVTGSAAIQEAVVDRWASAPQAGMFDAGPSAASEGTQRFGSLRVVGQVGATVIVCEGRDSLVLVDQHAAHERVNFDRLWRDIEAGRVASETLMFPEVVPLSPAEAGRLDSALPLLARSGFDVEPYSGDSVAVRAVPAVARGRSAGHIVRECLAAAGEEAVSAGTDRMRKVVATIACHASVRAGDPLTEDEARALLATMDGVADLAAYCPHGRQAVVTLPLSTVLRWFGR